MTEIKQFKPTKPFPELDEICLRNILGDFFLASFNSIVITGVETGNPIYYANPAFCRMTGYNSEELIGQSPAILQGPKTDQRVIQRMRQAIKEAKPFHGISINYRKNGESYPVEWNITPVTDSSGRLCYFLSVQRDMSDLRTVLSRLKRTNDHFRAFLRDLSTKPDSIDHKRQIATDLMDDLKQYDPALYLEDSSILADPDLFDLGATPVETKESAGPSIDAESYAKVHKLTASETNRLLSIVQETSQQLEVMAFSQISTGGMLDVANNLQELASEIFYLDEFVGLATTLADLATHTKDCAAKKIPSFMLTVYQGLTHDLESWINSVFLNRTARDIHELDDSIISSARQLTQFLPPT